jgi:NADH:ubiquinone oxidoreductase subunit D
MYESISIVFQILTVLTSHNTFNPKINLKEANFFNFFNLLVPQQKNKLNYNSKYLSMEALIAHFKHYSEGSLLPKGFAYKAVEAPKGEFGVSLISDGTANPYRCKIRTPAYHHMQVMPRMVQGHYFADLVTVLGSLDIVFGDVDR